ncbi:MAG: hypothetical protein HQL28_01885 [Candidatus Omnitrophica bacterium]|nr:hypothetical protein [Candidatus Omnitrophota bacterium]
MGIKNILLKVCIIAALVSGVPLTCCCQADASSKPTLIIFHSPSCHFCVKVKREIIPDIEKKYKNTLVLEYRDIDNIENYTLLLGLQEKHKITLTGSMPIFYMGGHFINGYDNIKVGWEHFVDGAMDPVFKEEPGLLPVVDIRSRFDKFTPAIIVSVGFLDGINPCAFTVIVFFMSFMALQGYKKRELIGIGLGFIFAVFVTYFLIGIGVFNFFYRLDRFWFVIKIINYSIGIFSVIFGILAAIDLVAYIKTKETSKMILQLPKGIKDQIHKVIRLFGRVVNRSTGASSRKRSSFKVIVSALITGFLVSLLEAVCTGQAYLPTISFILKTAPRKMEALGYLFLYNIVFVVPLVVIFIFAVFGVTSERFSVFFKKYLLSMKVLMAVLFLGFGVFLIWRA